MEKSIIGDLSASNMITRWAYEQATNAKAHVWVQGKETKPIGTYWRKLCDEKVAGTLMEADSDE